MKQFLYLDTDIVNSIIAQSEKGLIQEQSEESENDKKKVPTSAVGWKAQEQQEGASLS